MKYCNYILCLAMFTLLTVSSFSQIPTNGLIGYWPLNGDYQDYSGSNIHGVHYTGANPTADRFGNAAYAYSTDGVAGKLAFGTNTDFKFAANQDFSVSVWFKIEEPQVRLAGILGNGASSDYFPGWDIRNLDGDLLFEIGNGTQRARLYANKQYSSPGWHHLIVTVDRDGLAKMYYDGIQVGTEIAMSPYNVDLSISTPLVLGAWYGHHTKGEFDDVRIYNRVLSTTEVNALYREPNPNPPTGLLANWTFDGNPNDVSLNGLDGTLPATGTEYVADRNNANNKAIQFAGGTEHISIGDHPAVDHGFENGLSIAFWVKLNELPITNDKNFEIINKGPSFANIATFPDASPFNISFYRNNLLLFDLNGSSRSQCYANKTDWVVGQWYHVIATWDGTSNPNSQKIYINNVLDHSETPSFNALTTNDKELRIGRSNHFAINGALDDVRIYHRELSPQERDALYQAVSNSSSPWAQDASQNLSYTDGSVVIGGTDPGTYKLRVNGSVSASQVVVEVQNLADYVFEEDYDLRSLEEVEAFIDENGHLPEIPSAAQVKEEGMSVGDMNNLLLQKVEELTLYILEQNKTLQSQQATIEAQNQVLESLQKEIQEIKGNTQD